MKNNDPLGLVQGQFKNQSLWPSHLSTRSKWRTMTLSSQYKVGSKIKVYDPLVSVQGQFKNNVYDPLISVLGQKEKHRPSRLSKRSVQFKIYDLFVLVQSQFKVRDPLIKVQGLSLYPWIYFYFQTEQN